MGKTLEQNSQSTLINPSLSTMSRRSSSPNRAMTPRIYSKLQRHPLDRGTVGSTLISSSSWNRRQSRVSSGRSGSNSSPALIVSASTLTCSHRSEEHTSEIQSLMSISYAVFCLYKKNHQHDT